MAGSGGYRAQRQRRTKARANSRGLAGRDGKLAARSDQLRAARCPERSGLGMSKQFFGVKRALGAVLVLEVGKDVARACEFLDALQ
jgi:hypothetical protein